MLRRLRYLAAVAIPLLAAPLAFGDIAGSKHDFSAATWSNQQICKPCHTPHNAGAQALTGRLWAHTLSTQTYKYHGLRTTPADGITTTDDASGSAAQTDMDSASRLCLSCHDGTVALDSEVASRWRTFSDPGGDHAYAAEVGGQTVLVYGSAPQDELETLVESLTTAPLKP